MVGQIYINFNSNHPLSRKIRIIYHLVDKTFYLSDKQFYRRNLELIRSVLIDNDFPTEFISKHINKRWKHLTDKLNNRNNKTVNNKLDYSKTISFNYNLSTNRLIQSILQKYNIPIAFKNHNNLSKYYYVGKDKIDNKIKSGIIYKINGLDCKNSYSGRTGKLIVEETVGDQTSPIG